MSEPRADYQVYDIWDNGEFLTGCKVDLILDRRVVATETVTASSEFPNDGRAPMQAISLAQAWCESQNFTLEERLGPYGLEWEREQKERHFGEAPF